MLKKIYPRCFVETAEGALLAVVSPMREEGRVLCNLRYVHKEGRWQKLSTAESQAWLAQFAPRYLFYSQRLDCPLHGVPVEDIVKVYEPRQRLQAMLASGARDVVETRLLAIAGIFAGHEISADHIGVTGSVLVGVQRPDSDIDLLIFNREAFVRARLAVASEINSGRFQALDNAAWEAAYRKRNGSLSLAEYVAHERRKYNKFLYEGTKVDLSLAVVDRAAGKPGPVYRKQGVVKLQARVTDARYAFDYPYRYAIGHPLCSEVVSFTNTYAGQALAGETIEVVGFIEESDAGGRRIVVGADREAAGQYIKVIG